MHGRHESLVNLLDVGCHVLLGLCIHCVFHSFLDIHSIGRSAAVRQDIIAAWPASSYASTATEPLSDAACTVWRLTHVLLVVHA